MAALESWRNFPTYPAKYDGTCSTSDAWALNAWCASTSPWRDPTRPHDKLWMHWLDDPDDCDPLPTGELFESHTHRVARRIPGAEVPLAATQVVPSQRHTTPPPITRASLAGAASSAV